MVEVLALKNQRTFRIIRGLYSCMFHFSTPMITHYIKTQTISFFIHLLNQFGAQFQPLTVVHQTLEYRKLHTLPPACAQLGYPPQAATTCGIFRIYIITDKYQHDSPYDKRGICIDIATNETGKKPSLHMV